MLSAEATAMFREAAEGPAAAARFVQTNARLLDRVVGAIREHDPLMIVTCARGSSDHAATFGKYLFETMLGLPTASHAPSISSLYQRPLHLNRALFLAVSQSGGSPDLVRSAEFARSRGALVVGLINVPDSPLSAVCDWTIPLCAGPERSIAATKSVITSLAALSWLAALWAEDAALIGALGTLPEQLAAAWETDWSAALPFLLPADHLFVISRGLGLAIAQEVALKCKETCGLHAEAFSAAEVRHGPMALVHNGFPALLLNPGDVAHGSIAGLVDEFVTRGAPVGVAQATDIPGHYHPDSVLLPSPRAAHFALQPLVLLQAAYRLMATLAVARGFNPDEPPFLKKVTQTL